MRTVVAWLKASRLPSQSYIALPLLLGQLVWYQQSGELNLTILIAVQLFGLFDQFFIVYGNDYADLETDRLNTTATVFSGGSRVLVEGDLQPASLRRATQLMAGLCLAIGLALGVGFGRWWAPAIIAGGLLFLWAYSFKPLALNYRGGGELLQSFGVGGLLPVFGFYAQAGTLAGFPWVLLAVLLPTHVACAIATALPDEPSDRASHKRTAVVLLGPRGARLAVIGLNGASLFAFIQVGGLPLDSGIVVLLLAIPTVANLAQLLLLDSQPGTRRVLVHVFLAILVTMSLVVTLGIVQVMG